MSHTAGLWTPIPGHLHNPIRVAAESGRAVAFVERVFGKPVEGPANARLIAAAPELLAALRYFLQAWNDGGNIALAMTVDEAEAAIAKAEGRAP